VRMCICAYVCMFCDGGIIPGVCVCMCMCAYLCVCVHICVCVRMFVCVVTVTNF